MPSCSPTSSHQPEPGGALAEYEASRRPRAEAVLKMSRRVDKAAQLASPLGWRFRTHSSGGCPTGSAPSARADRPRRTLIQGPDPPRTPSCDPSSAHPSRSSCSRGDLAAALGSRRRVPRLSALGTTRSAPGGGSPDVRFALASRRSGRAAATRPQRRPARRRLRRPHPPDSGSDVPEGIGSGDCCW